MFAISIGVLRKLINVNVRKRSKIVEKKFSVVEDVMRY